MKLFKWLFYRKEVCPLCEGDGYGRCNNPDHGFIRAVGGEIGRLGCPCCGHDEHHRMFGESCELCGGTGEYEHPLWDKDRGLRYVEENY